MIKMYEKELQDIELEMVVMQKNFQNSLKELNEKFQKLKSEIKEGGYKK